MKYIVEIEKPRQMIVTEKHRHAKSVEYIDMHDLVFDNESEFNEWCVDKQNDETGGCGPFSTYRVGDELNELLEDLNADGDLQERDEVLEACYRMEHKNAFIFTTNGGDTYQMLEADYDKYFYSETAENIAMLDYINERREEDYSRSHSIYNLAGDDHVWSGEVAALAALKRIRAQEEGKDIIE